MPLFVVSHRHEEARCPAGDPEKGAMLVRRLSEQGTERFGITIHAHAVIDGLHTLSMILDAPDTDAIEKFMVPLAQGGSFSVQPASPCEDIIARGHC